MKNLSGKLSLALSGLAIVMASTGGAYAAAKIGTAQIKNSAVTSAKIKNSSIAVADLSAPVKVKLATKGGRGPQGERGQQGPQGDPGPAGTAVGSVTVQGVLVDGTARVWSQHGSSNPVEVRRLATGHYCVIKGWVNQGGPYALTVHGSEVVATLNPYFYGSTCSSLGAPYAEIRFESIAGAAVDPYGFTLARLS